MRPDINPDGLVIDCAVCPSRVECRHKIYRLPCCASQVLPIDGISFRNALPQEWRDDGDRRGFESNLLSCIFKVLQDGRHLLAVERKGDIKEDAFQPSTLQHVTEGGHIASLTGYHKVSQSVHT